MLSTIAAQFDLLNFNGPLMNRSKLFLHRLQCQKQLEWDEKLSADQISEWRNIAKQANSAPPIEFPRNFGSRNDYYKLIGFADSSKAIFSDLRRGCFMGLSTFIFFLFFLFFLFFFFFFRHFCPGHISGTVTRRDSKFSVLLGPAV